MLVAEVIDLVDCKNEEGLTLFLLLVYYVGLLR
jgi:hypothetical protein